MVPCSFVSIVVSNDVPSRHTERQNSKPASEEARRDSSSRVACCYFAPLDNVNLQPYDPAAKGIPPCNQSLLVSSIQDREPDNALPGVVEREMQAPL